MKIKSIEKFKNVLDNIVVNEEQQTALHEFFSEFSNILKEKIREEVLLENTQEPAPAMDETTFEEKLIEIKKQWEEEKLSEIEKLKESIREEYGLELTNTLEELYETVEAKVKADLSKTKEFVALETIKEAILPLINNNDAQKLAKEVGELRKEKQVLESYLNETKLENIIEDLVADFEPKKADVIREFLSECTDEESIYKTFNRVVSIFETKEEEEEILEEDEDLLPTNEEEEENEEEEAEEDEQEDDQDEEEIEISDSDDEEVDLEIEEESTVVDINDKRQKKLDLFTETEKNILKKVFF